MTKRNALLFSVISLLAVSALPAFADDLLSVYKSALANDPQFHAAQAAYRAQLESKNQSSALLYPSISLSANVTNNDEKVTIPTPSTTTPYNYKSSGYNLSLVQPLYRHANFVGLSQADAQVAQAQATLDSAKQDLILRVATRYFAVLAAEDDLSFAKAERTAIHQQLIQTQQRYKVGLIAITDVQEAQARYDQTVASAIVAENALAISRETLREVTASEPGQLAPLSPTHPLIKPEPADINQWVSKAMTQNALLTATKSAVEVAREEVSRQRAGHFPTLDLVANHSYGDYGGGQFGNREVEDTTVSLQLNVPLFQGGLVSSLTRAASYRLQEAKDKLEQQSRATERQTRNSYLSVIANISRVTALKQALASSEVALKATQAGFEVGTRTAVDVLDSQRGRYSALRDYAQVRYNYVLETLRLKQAAGTLSEMDIQQLNPWLK